VLVRPRLESVCKVRDRREANERMKGTINKYDFLLWKKISWHATMWKTRY
jgi:hypothetical protein